MSGVSKKTPLPHWQKIMDQCGWLTAADVSRAAGLSKQTVHRVIYGEVTPSYETIMKIAKAAKASPKDILYADFDYKIGTFAPIVVP